MCTAYLYNWSQASTCQRLLEHFFHIAQRWSTARAGHSGLMTHLVGLFTRRATVPPGQQGNASAATGSGITLCIAPTHWVTSKGEAGGWQWTSVQVRIPFADVDITGGLQWHHSEQAENKERQSCFQEKRLTELPFQSTPQDGFPHKSVDQAAFDFLPGLT